MFALNKIYLKDCLSGMQDIPDKSIDMILADLPYEQTASGWDKRIHLGFLWLAYERIIKDNGAIVLTAAQPFTTALISSNARLYRYNWYWEKNQGTNFFHAKRMPIRKIEDIVVFYKNQPTYNPQMTMGHIPTNSAKGCSAGSVYHGKNKRDYVGGKTSRYPTDILKIKCVNNYERVHPNQKPLELFEYMIKTYTNPNDLVLDNVMGSGTTAIACLKTDRRFIGFETSKEYIDIANNRIINFLEGDQK